MVLTNCYNDLTDIDVETIVFKEVFSRFMIYEYVAATMVSEAQGDENRRG